MTASPTCCRALARRPLCSSKTSVDDRLHLPVVRWFVPASPGRRECAAVLLGPVPAGIPSSLPAMGNARDRHRGAVGGPYQECVSFNVYVRCAGQAARRVAWSVDSLLIIRLGFFRPGNSTHTSAPLWRGFSLGSRDLWEAGKPLSPAAPDSPSTSRPPVAGSVCPSLWRPKPVNNSV